MLAPIEEQEQMLREKPAEWWEEEGAKKALAVFHAAAERVPAYKDFLRKNKLQHEKIKTIEDFKTHVPTISKKNYLKLYPLKDLCWDGDLSRMNVISVSSGSTGEPFFWPRDIWQEREVDHLYELVYRYLFNMHEKRSLVIIAFAMGMYIAGPFTFASTLRIAQKGYPITVVSSSNDINAISSTVQNLSEHYDQIVLGGYPPLILDAVETINHAKVLKKGKIIKLFFGGEGFSERWRDHINDLINTTSYLTSSINMYGTADSALLGIETPLSIAFRRISTKDKKSLTENFASQRPPSILSFNPLIKYFSQLDNNLLLTSSSGIPLIKYSIGDVGGTIRYSQAMDLVSKNKNDSLYYTDNWHLPLVYLFGRDDFTVHIYGANVYPENIKECLEDNRINSFLTGKYILTTEYTRGIFPQLNLKIELKNHISPSRRILHLAKKVIIQNLININSEYSDAYSAYRKKVEPRIKLTEYGNPEFKIKIKHPWVKKNS